MESECSVINNCGNTSNGTTTTQFFKFPMAFESFDMLRGDAVPVMVKMKPQGKYMREPKKKTKHKRTKCSLVDATPVSSSLNQKLTEEEINSLMPGENSYLKNKLIAQIIDNMLPVRIVKLENVNTSSSTNDSNPRIPIIKEELRLPDEIEDILSCPLANKEDNYIISDFVLNTSKIEDVDIVEEPLCDTYKDIDERMEMETDEEEFVDLPEYSGFDEHLDDPSFLLDINDVQYLNDLKGKSFDQRRRDAMRQARARQRETPEQRALRLEKTRFRAQERRKDESEVQTTIRRYKSAVRAAVKRSDETDEEKKIRQEKNKIRAAERRKNMTPKERAEWREKNRIQTRERRQKESEIKKIVRRYNNAIRASIKRSSETPEQRMERRFKDALRAAERRKLETPDERQERLRKDRERITLRRLQMLVSETPEQREARLKKERDRMYRKRHGIKGDLSAETSNDGMHSQQDSEDYDISAVLSMYPPSIEIQTPDDAQSGNAERMLS